MDAISIRCKSCSHPMKFAVEKAGKKVKCPKCGTINVIEAIEEPVQKANKPLSTPTPAMTLEKPPEAPAPAGEDDALLRLMDVDEIAKPDAPAPPPSKEQQAVNDLPIKLVADPDEAPKMDSAGVEIAKVDPFAADGPANYGVYLDPELEERKRILAEEEAAKAKVKKKDKKKLPKMTRKVKAIEQADDWARVRTGLLFVFIGVCCWVGAHLLQGLYVLVGWTELPEYANLISTTLAHRVEPMPKDLGEFWDVDELDIYLGIIAGKNWAAFGAVCLTIASVLYVPQAVCWLLGYILAFNVPRRFGMFGNVLTMIALTVFNGFSQLTFKLLPILGVYNYIMIPLVTPEVCLTEYNMERTVPIHVLWSGSPFWENFATVLFKFALYLEPTMMCVFLWSVGKSIKNEELEQTGKAATQFCLGTFFILLAFHMLSLCGATGVLVGTLRVIYTTWYFFVILFALYYAKLLMKARSAIEEKIHPKNEQD